MADSRTESAKAFLNKERTNLNKYHGGMPIGFLAAIAEHESSGRMSAIGDASLGEVGYFQVPIETANDFDVDPQVRYSAEGNIFLACLEYQVNAARIAKRFPWIRIGSMDQWMFARLVFAVGIGATGTLLRNFTGGTYSQFVQWAQSNSTGKQLARINDVVVQWNIGQALAPEAPGPPTKIPAFVPYSIPKDVSGLLQSPLKQLLLPLALGIGLFAVVSLT